jgi:UDPglucose--hexose-1-phosphate uridylyltransferase
MPELRRDPVSGRWVILSTDRARRPLDFKPERPRTGNGHCPFCRGREETTPPEILAYRPDGSPPNTPGWTLRVVPNKFPALQIEGSLNRKGDGIYDMMNGIGAHEVIIETPEHETSLARIDVNRIEDVLYAYRDRIRDLQQDQRLRYVLIFKNYGEEAGASLEHSHSQLIALPILPRLVNTEVARAEEFWKEKERCIFCDIITQEIEDAKRIVARNEHFLALAPYAPRFPFETWILPTRHASDFDTTPPHEFPSLARMLSEVLRRMDRALADPPYNYVLHNAPFKDRQSGHYHWHIEIMPKLTRVAGFESGSGFYINPTPPEDAARFLREVELD